MTKPQKQKTFDAPAFEAFLADRLAAYSDDGFVKDSFMTRDMVGIARDCAKWQFDQNTDMRIDTDLCGVPHSAPKLGKPNGPTNLAKFAKSQLQKPREFPSKDFDDVLEHGYLDVPKWAKTLALDFAKWGFERGSDALSSTNKDRSDALNSTDSNAKPDENRCIHETWRGDHCYECEKSTDSDAKLRRLIESQKSLAQNGIIHYERAWELLVSKVEERLTVLPDSVTKTLGEK